MSPKSYLHLYYFRKHYGKHDIICEIEKFEILWTITSFGSNGCGKAQILIKIFYITARDPFYIIAHMTNTIHAVDWAVAKGANAIEIDLEFKADGTPFRFIHSPSGEACDCTCMCPM